MFPAITLILLTVYIYVIFWQVNLIFAQIWGAPTVYANDRAIIDAFKLANLKKDQLVLDLGCGDGRSLILAAQRFGAKGIGIERSPYCWMLANIHVLLSGQRANVKILFGDMQKAERTLGEAELVYVYLLEKVLTEKESWIFKHLKKNASIVSLAFKFKVQLPVKIVETTNLGRKTNIYLYKKTDKT